MLWTALLYLTSRFETDADETQNDVQTIGNLDSVWYPLGHSFSFMVTPSKRIILWCTHIVKELIKTKKILKYKTVFSIIVL